ncbi:PREDICTED: neuroligin 4-like [Eufriesea mexicana]|uniref:neuroligin 4-like n=1 Tax=Eufriesea mexicana TaxID=516756 RepID=UPI00083C3F9A|nr:PREDICTED: neuroligin 4-like [Eufriesea mexicana]
MTSSILALLGLILATASAELSSRVVRTKYGELSGVIVTLDRNLEGVEVFRGVPYASPPIGSLRFMPPVNGAIWQGVKVADKFGPVCPQRLPELSDEMPKGRLEYLRRLLPYLRNQSEDCLYLNIYTPVQALKCDDWKKGLSRGTSSLHGAAFPCILLNEERVIDACKLGKLEM